MPGKCRSVCGSDAKIVENCSLPLNGRNVVDRVITDLAVMDVSRKGLVLADTAPWVSIKTVRATTGAQFSVSAGFVEMSAVEP